jgi:hypothetical protein
LCSEIWSTGRRGHAKEEAAGIQLAAQKQVLG